MSGDERRMKKYQLKFHPEGTDINEILEESNKMYDIMWFIRFYKGFLSDISIWMDGKVLE